MNLPRLRDSDLVVRELEKELLIYDLRINKAYNLNETSKVVVQACDGKTSFAELKKRSKFTDEMIHFALEELGRCDLLEDYQGNYFANMNRRQIIRKIGLASMVALPVISSLIAPTASHAQSIACTNSGNPQGQGTCFGGQRCVGGRCSACIATGDSLPGGCTTGTVARCCSAGCNVPSGTCIGAA